MPEQPFPHRYASRRLYTALAFLSALAFSLPAEPLRFDCGTANSPVQSGYKRLTADEAYSSARGYGWESPDALSVEFANPGFLRNFIRPREEAFATNLTDLNRDAVISTETLRFRADVPDGEYRVILTIGNMAQALGSIDVKINGELAETGVTAFTPGGYRNIVGEPYGWWTQVRRTAKAKDGAIRVELSKNQAYYDEQMAIQSKMDNPFSVWYPAKPKEQFKKEPPYDYIGFPFAHNSLMAVEILPETPAPVALAGGTLKAGGPLAQAGGVSQTIDLFNKGQYGEAVAALKEISAPEAQIARAILSLHLAGRLEVEEEESLVQEALPVLRRWVKDHPGDAWAGGNLVDAEDFYRGLRHFLDRGDPKTEANHFIEIDKAIGWWWLQKEDSPLFDKAQLYIARGSHMLRPYRPTLGPELQILKNLEKKYPDNRFVKYHLYYEWENFGDGTKFNDWHLADYESRVKDSPDWVKSLYVAFSQLIDVSEWWIQFKQHPDGSIGGGLSDDVEMVGAFGYVGFVGRGVSDKSIQGARNLVEGIWKLPEDVFHAELGYQTPCADTEHTAELTGDSLPMVVNIDYGNPRWIELSFKTGQLMRDLWTAPDKNGHRHFRANFLGATQVGKGDQANDSWINYRAVAPAMAVLWYNQNPAISKLVQEIADGWVAAAMSTERGKPRGILPAQVSFPDALLGGTNSPNWWTASKPAGTVNYDWPAQLYKDLLHDVLIAAYTQTGDVKYVEPLRMEFEFAGERRPTGSGQKNAAKPAPDLKPGSDEWVAANLKNTDVWERVKRTIDGRQGELKLTKTREEIVKACKDVVETLHWRWPLMTTESSATDRVYFGGWHRPLTTYCGGQLSGRGFRAAVTYENTTRHFAAAVLGSDPQGIRMLYHSLTDDEREIGIVPWELEPGGKYTLRFGPDADEDNSMDSTTEERTFEWRQRGEPIHIRVKPRTTYLIEVDQVTRGSKPGLAPDPAVTADDIRKVEGRNLLTARIHNVGSLPADNIKVAFFDGDPDMGGLSIGTAVLPHLEAPVDLSPRTVTVGVDWNPTKLQHEIFVVVDPDDEIENEITSFNNKAHATLPQPETKPAKPAKASVVGGGGGGRGRR